MNHTVSTFDTDEPNLVDILGRIRSGQIQLPDFQRGWVWDDNRIRAIISSVSKSYPIGAIMTMEIGNNVRFLPRPFEGVELSPNLRFVESYDVRLWWYGCGG